MKLFGAVFNGLAIAIGALIGHLFGNVLKDELKVSMEKVMGLAVLVIGILGLSAKAELLDMIISMVLGYLLGEFIDIDSLVNRFASWLQTKLTKSDSSDFQEGFVSMSLLACIGAMAVVGSFEAGLSNNQETLIAKSVIDGVTAVILGSTYGMGVALSGLMVFIYEGALTLFAGAASHFMTDALILEISNVGSVLIMALGLNMLDLTDFKVANMLPAIFMPLIVMPVLKLF